MCEMCSSDDAVYRIELEGSVLNVCEKCASFGRIISKIKKEEPIASKKKSEEDAKAALKKEKKITETVQLIVNNYSDLIRKAREKLGLKQEDFAKKINEKESVIHKLETGDIKPDIELARKLERFLKIKLVEEVEIEPSLTTEKRNKSEGLTIGDLINIK